MKKTIAILLAFCLCVGLCACGQDSTADSTTAPSEEAVPTQEELLQAAEEVTLDQIGDDQKDNELKAKQLYCGKALKITGIIRDIEPGLARLCGEGSFNVGVILVHLPDDVLISLHEGQKVVVVGQTAEEFETYTYSSGSDVQLIAMTTAYVIQNTFSISGIAWSANDDFAPAFNFDLEGTSFSPLIYFAESVDISVFPDKNRTITVEGKFIYDSGSLSDILDAIIVE